MEGFIQKYQDNVTGVLNGWDRLRIRGTLRALAVTSGMMNYLWHIGVLLKDFGSFVEQASGRLKQACQQTTERLNRPIRYLPSSQTSKEDLAVGMAQAQGITQGLVCTETSEVNSEESRFSPRTRCGQTMAIVLLFLTL